MGGLDSFDLVSGRASKCIGNHMLGNIVWWVASSMCVCLPVSPVLLSFFCERVSLGCCWLRQLVYVNSFCFHFAANGFCLSLWSFIHGEKRCDIIGCSTW